MLAQYLLWIDCGRLRRELALFFREPGAGPKIIAERTDAFAIRERPPDGLEIWMRFALAPTST